MTRSSFSSIRRSFQTRHASGAQPLAEPRGHVHAVYGGSGALFVVEAGYFGADDEKVLSLLPKNVPVLLVTNKLDRLGENRAEVMMPFLEKDGAAVPVLEAVPMSGEDARSHHAAAGHHPPVPARRRADVRRRCDDRP